MASPDHLTFSIFPQFPTEVRLEIWRLCLPQRVLELDYPVDETVFSPGELPWWYRTNHKITNYNTRVPVIARVCRESRQVVFESWAELSLPEQNDPAYWSQGWRVYPEPWFDRLRTSFIHLGWFSARDIESSYNGDPIRHLIWVAAKTQHSRVSISQDFLLEHSGNATESDPWDHGLWTRNELADLIRQLPEWAIVIQGSVVVTTDDVHTAAATDLFGLLADSRVQIVEADDEPQMDRFLALGETPGVALSLSGFNDTDEVTFSSTTVKEAIEAARRLVSECVIAIFGSEAKAPGFHTAVMFRLCTKMGGPDD